MATPACPSQRDLFEHLQGWTHVFLRGAADPEDVLEVDGIQHPAHIPSEPESPRWRPLASGSARGRPLRAGAVGDVLLYPRSPHAEPRLLVTKRRPYLRKRALPETCGRDVARDVGTFPWPILAISHGHGVWIMRVRACKALLHHQLRATRSRCVQAGSFR